MYLFTWSSSETLDYLKYTRMCVNHPTVWTWTRPLPPNVFTVGNTWVIKYLPMWLIAVFAAAGKKKKFMAWQKFFKDALFPLCCDCFFIFFPFRMDFGAYNLFVSQLA